MRKNTQELLELLKNTKNIEDYLREESDSLQELSLSEYLAYLLTEKKLKKSQCIRDANLQRNYGYQIFAGERVPSRDKIISLCFAMKLTLRETHSLLCATGYPDLYPRDKRDSILIFALERELTVMETDELLYEMGEKTLTGAE